MFCKNRFPILKNSKNVICYHFDFHNNYAFAIKKKSEK